ncbi:MAG: UDP-N-acetylglucosamine 1-carboxyvinyltransferase [Puniceicoccaceae bacterium]|jgi:UDP-N-acetylglucosamine 1-carboxyvinyltransferase|nr:UDP-N-acetylglucosamine 1-carboxyvinyltransferase [Puniceicoccaceae bacterium]MBL6838420.1 UDP-N-acetylglucosamine 1-carboxyvinyltransferase [Puniceicoccaceae bacterium]MBL6912320.1 UDP-N-acetylglucosamine 1-carboxyvinyltransferase [Puniceicoccaceae bacterium]
MDVFKVSGSGPLHGQIEVGGAKNAALPILAATLLTDETVVLRNVPDLSDMRFMLEILRHIGAETTQPEPGVWEITSKQITHIAPYELVRKMRASVCLLGPLVARMRKAEVSIPGGCVIGPRPIDLHIKGLKKLNCQVEISNGYVRVNASKIKGGPIFLGGRSGSTVTGTANIVMAAVLAPGTTRLECAACEPEVVDLCQLLVKMGARIEGIGSPELTITGVDKLHGCEHSVIADRIEAGTFVIAAAITRGDVTVKGIAPKLLGAFLDKLEEAGLPMELGEDSIRVLPYQGSLKPVDVITLPHPGYPTDLQAQLSALMTQTDGLSIITERIYPNRFMHVPELQRMGADISIEGPSAIIKGASKLSGAPVMASDLRASAALILAAFAAEGDTWIQRIYHLDRGYERFEQKLTAIGAKIERLSEKEMPKELLED